MDAMADDVPPTKFRAGAIDRLKGWLEATLNASELEPAFIPARFTHGWLLTLDVGGTSMDLHMFIDEQFPWTAPRVGLSPPPPFPSYPHVERDGLVCVLSHVAECDPYNVIGSATLVLAGAADILTQGLAGTNANEFRTEFLSYWNANALGKAISILDPCGPSRAISVWPGKKWLLAAENPSSIRSWLLNRFEKRHVAESTLTRGLVLWLDQLPKPTDYPSTIDGVAAMATAAGAGDLLSRLMTEARQELLVLFGADTGNGVCWGAVNLVKRKSHGRHGKRGPPPRCASIIAVRHAVERADAWWIHGRDSNEDLTDLRTMRVVMIGCGSLGSPIARLLAQAGVGQLDLIDPEVMEWANTSRHALGAESVPAGKAVQLAAQLSRGFPHSRFVGHGGKWQAVDVVLEGSDLIVSSVGSWRAEGALNERLLGSGLPPIIYAWTEPHGVAGHALALGRGSGCLQCQLGEHGEPLAQVVDWEHITLKQEPACGAHFQPYGASAIMNSAVLAADLALDVLLERAAPSTYRIASALSAVIERLGGTWGQAWTKRTGYGSEGGRIEEFAWLPNISCRACAGKGLP